MMLMSDTDRRAGKTNRVAIAGWTIGIVVIAAIFLILAKAVSKPSSTSNGTASTDGKAPASLIAKITGISEATYEAVGQGTSNPLPKAITGAPALTDGGKPQIFYAGAEYCPYCATERWPMTIALLRFGTFTGLGTTHSSTTDVFPNTQTFSFHGATYTSQYISFTGLEMQSNVPSGTTYATLDTPTAAQQSLISTYDAAPYVPSDSAGAIPFIDFGGKFIISGSTYSPSVLQGKSYDQITAALSQPTSDIGKGAIGAANAITAAICTMTNNQPANVCANSMIQGLQAKLSGQ